MDDGLVSMNKRKNPRALPCDCDLMTEQLIPQGIEPGRQVLVSGPPGIGKSTLLLQTLLGFMRSGVKCIYASSEEDRVEIRRRLETLIDPVTKMTVDVEEVRSLDDLAKLSDKIRAKQYRVVIIDSLQEIGLDSSMRREWAAVYEFSRAMKEIGVTTFFLAHATKDEHIAGPRKLEHIVDTVIIISGAMDYRLIRVTKNRGGKSMERPLLCAKNGVGKLAPVRLGSEPETGRAFTFDMHGLVEVQAVVEFGSPLSRHPIKPVLNGITKPEYGKVETILRKMGVDLDGCRVTCVLPGRRVMSPEHELALAMAIWSSYIQRSIPGWVVFCAELTLDGVLVELPKQLRDHLFGEFLAERLAINVHDYVMNEMSMRSLWSRMDELPFPFFALGFDTLKDVAREFLLPNPHGIPVRTKHQ